MKKPDNIIYFRGEKYVIIKSTRYLGNDYIFVINTENVYNIKLLICLDELKEIDDIELIKKIILQMK